jgi:hypothetical protein
VSRTKAKASTHSRNMQLRIAGHYIDNKKINKQTSYRAVAVHFSNKNRVVTENQVQNYVQKMKQGHYEFSGGRRTNKKIAKKALKIVEEKIDIIEAAESESALLLAKIQADQDAEANVNIRRLNDLLSIMEKISKLKLEKSMKTPDAKFLRELVWMLVPEERGNEGFAIEMVLKALAAL